MISTAIIFTCTVYLGQALPNGVASGDVTHTTAVLWARASASGVVTFDVARDNSFDEILVRASVDVQDVMVPAKVLVDGLSPGAQYAYRATDSAGRFSPGTFTTPHAYGVAGLRFGVSGDWRGELGPYPAVSNVSDRALDLFVALGDTIYADFPSPAVPIEQATTLEQFRAKHDEIYRTRFGVAWLADVRASTALLATIDDHEVTNDFSGGASPAVDDRFDDTAALVNETDLYNNGMQAFHEYHPLREEFYGSTGDPVTAGKRKLYRQRTYGLDAALFLLDARSFRDAPVVSLAPGSTDTTIAGFLEASFAPGRTMLGAVQIAALERDLLDAEANGVTWKFVLVPEPIQNFGPFFAEDRFEGYAAERTRLLRFIHDHDLHNVVFVAADIHGTVINNLNYRESPDGPEIPTRSFEVTTGSVAFAPPFAPAAIMFADLADLGFIADLGIGVYRAVARPLQETLVVIASNIVLGQFGYNPIGLEDADIQARIDAGQWVAVHTYGWTEFDIDATTHTLTISTYGIPWYSATDLLEDPAAVISRTPRIVSRVIVDPRCPAGTHLACGDLDAPRPPATCGVLGALNSAVLCAGLVVLRCGAGRRRRRVCRLSA